MIMIMKTINNMRWTSLFTRLSHLGNLPDVKLEDANSELEEQLLKVKRSFQRRNISHFDVLKEQDASFQQLKALTPGSCLDKASEYVSILVMYDALTGDTHRDKCLEKLLQGVQYIFYPGGNKNEGR
ncbi:hypothetical protein SAY86_004608 [Trapa natans]|uniref:Uncharacterized protein n=1 Tax=Trapa natans TaxID=22666 RepID=A0AAN7MIU5_TRANT|nr:hypothetical protein SAY86_004608 [Trapa natans]